MTRNSNISRPPSTAEGRRPAFARARRHRATLAAVLCSLVASVAAAQSEQFIYPLGSSINLNGGTGWSGPWITNGAVVVPGLTYPNLGALGNALGPTPGSAAVRSFANPVVGAAGTSVMLSALIRSPNAGDPATQATLGNSAGGTFIIGDLPQADAAAGTWGLQTGAGRFYSNVPVLATQTTYLVALIDFNVAGSNDRIRLWVNPPANGWFTTQPKIDDSSSDVPTFSGVFWQTQQGQSVDEIRVARTSTACVAPPNTTMVAWYPFDETSGAVADNLATQNDGFYGQPTPPTPVPGLVNGALRFDGIDDFVFSPSSIVTNFGPASTAATGSGRWSTARGDFSIDVWVRIPSSVSPNQLMVILDKRLGNIPTIKGYSLYVQSNRIGVQLADGVGASGFSNHLSSLLPNGGALNDDNWHHLAVTVRRAGGPIIRFYHNGAPLGVATPTRLASLANSSPMAIGTRSASTALTGWYEGILDELEVFNRALSGAEVTAIYAAGPFGKCKQ